MTIQREKVREWMKKRSQSTTTFRCNCWQKGQLIRLQGTINGNAAETRPQAANWRLASPLFTCGVQHNKTRRWCVFYFIGLCWAARAHSMLVRFIHFVRNDLNNQKNWRPFSPDSHWLAPAAAAVSRLWFDYFEHFPALNEWIKAWRRQQQQQRPAAATCKWYANIFSPTLTQSI